ncbi:MAG: Ig-like domain-containing protein [Deltaproteobacteria bacterium]
MKKKASFFAVIMIFAFESFSQIPKTYADFWQNIELTSSKAKLVHKGKKSRVRKYITIGTAGVLTGGILYFSDVFQNDKIEAIDDVYKVVCGEKYKFNPIENDRGNNLRIKSFTGNPSGLVFTDSNTFLVTPEITNSFSFNYTIEDEKGNTSVATVFIEITKQTLNLDIINLNTESGMPVSGNILSDMVCISCNLTNMSGPPEASYIWKTDGSFEVLIHNLSGIENLYKFVLTIEGDCIQKTNVDLLINVKPKICDIDPEFKMIPANCDSDDGSILIISEMDPLYSFLWSDGSTSKDLINVKTGHYKLKVSNSTLSCSKEFSFNLDEKKPEYYDKTDIQSGNCITSGKILTNILGDSDDYFSIIVVSQEGSFEYTVGAGKVDIAQLISVSLDGKPVTGKYNIKIRNLSKSTRCTQEVNIEIPLDSLPFITLPDNFNTKPNVVLKDNVLKNDLGTGLNVVKTDQIPGASLKMEKNGDFEFIGNIGYYSYTYYVADTCGNHSQDILKIEVSEIVCDYKVNFVVTPAFCGAETGVIIANVMPDDGAFLKWNNGKSGRMITDLKAGVYTLTITHPSGSCFQEFIVEMPEQPFNYILSSEIIQPDCENAPEIIYDLYSPISDFILMDADGPHGTYQAVLPTGMNKMSEYMDLYPGMWSFLFNDIEAPEQCTTSFTCVIEQYILPELTVSDIKNPSNPSSDDGIVIVNIAGGNPPFSVSIPGREFTGLQPGINLLFGFTQGVFELTAIDNSGCASNTLVVELTGSSLLAIKNSYLYGVLAPMSEIIDFKNIESVKNENNFLFHNCFQTRLVLKNFYFQTGIGTGNLIDINRNKKNILRSNIYYMSFGQIIKMPNSIFSLGLTYGNIYGIDKKETHIRRFSNNYFVLNSDFEIDINKLISTFASLEWFNKEKILVLAIKIRFNF